MPWLNNVKLLNQHVIPYILDFKPEYSKIMWRKNGFLSFIIFIITVLSTQAQADKVLWYDKPANYFEETLVLGNGTMGATIFGGVDTEKIFLNDATLWSGEPVKPNPNSENYKVVAKIRKALQNENYEEADSLQTQLQGPYSQSYMPLGTLYIDFGDAEGISNYYRELDLNTATAKVTYTQNDIKFRREYFISHPDKIMVIKLTSSKKASINCSLNFESLLKFKTEIKNNEININGYAPYNVEPNYRRKIANPISFDEDRGTRFTSLFKVKSKDGTIKPSNNTLHIKNSSEVYIYVSIATSFNGFDKDPAKEGKNHKAIAAKNMTNAFSKTYDTLKSKHEEDYKNLFNRVEFNIDTAKTSKLPTDQRLLNYTAGAEDKNLEALYFNYGRYLLISSSRTEAVPANLQGIWNPYIRPPWSSNYTVNVNVEENYWGAEIANLSELHLPLLQYIKNAAVTGANSAKTYYGTNGWVVCHNSDIWAMSNPVGEHEGNPRWANWNLGGVWLSTHLWEHYQFTQDKTFLEKEAYPLMKGAVEFCIDWMIKDKNGKWITSPSTSPENVFLTPSGYKGATLYGATSDLAMIRELFNNFINTCKILNIKNDLKHKVIFMSKDLYPYQIGKKGHLQEWYYDWEDEDPKHRHQSQLFGLFPGHHITPYKTPELAKACKTSLDIKGDDTTGWSKGWRINLWARLWEGNRAYKMYRELLNYVEPDGMKGKFKGGGTYPNLFDAHPPFQIDGNFGGSAAVIEMLLQSTNKHIFLLPALPDAWSTGSVKGICARGGYEVSMVWEKGKLISATIHAKVDGNTTVVYKEQEQNIELKKGASIELNW